MPGIVRVLLSVEIGDPPEKALGARADRPDEGGVVSADALDGFGERYHVERFRFSFRSRLRLRSQFRSRLRLRWRWRWRWRWRSRSRLMLT